MKGLEPPSREALDPKSSVSTNFTTPARTFPKGAANIDFISISENTSHKNPNVEKPLIFGLVFLVSSQIISSILVSFTAKYFL